MTGFGLFRREGEWNGYCSPVIREWKQLTDEQRAEYNSRAFEINVNNLHEIV